MKMVGHNVKMMGCSGRCVYNKELRWVGMQGHVEPKIRDISNIHKYPGGLFIEPAFSTFAVFVIDFIPQITVVLHLSQKFSFLKKYARTFHWICKTPQRHSLFFCAKCSSQFLQ